MPHVKLRDTWEGTFHRSTRDADGNVVRRLEFSPGEVVEVTPDEIPSIQGDLGKALLPVAWSVEKRKFVVLDLNRIDTEASAQQEGAIDDGSTAGDQGVVDSGVSSEGTGSPVLETAGGTPESVKTTDGGNSTDSGSQTAGEGGAIAGTGDQGTGDGGESSPEAGADSGADASQDPAAGAADGGQSKKTAKWKK